MSVIKVQPNNLLQLDEETNLEEAQSLNLDKRTSGAKGQCRG